MSTSILLRIDFVSDVVCPWCAIAYKSLEKALLNLDDGIAVEIHFQPFELNPQMGPEGEDIIEHLTRKYGAPPEQMQRNQVMIQQRGADVGFVFDMSRRSRIVNTFDAHRLLHWAGLVGFQSELKLALLTAYFTDGRDVSKHDVLADVAGEAGLDPAEAREVLASQQYAAEVRAREQRYQASGIRAVPALIVNDQYLIEGGQTPEAYESVLRKIVAAL